MYRCFLIILLPLQIWAQNYDVNALQQRLDQLKEYEKASQGYINEIQNIKDQISEYRHQNMLDKDQELLTQANEALNQHIKLAQRASDSFLTYSVQRKIDELQTYVKFQQIYEDKQIELKNLQNDANNRSKRYQNFIAAVQAKKYTKQDILKATLLNEEKDLANKYLEIHNSLLRDSDTYDFNQKKIKNLASKIEEAFKFPEQSYQTIETVKILSQKKEKEFSNLKRLHKLVQYDVTLGSWESGLFSCKPENKPEYWRFNNYPDLVALVNNGQVKSVLKISAENPTKKEYVYHCQNSGMLGGCLDNTKKKLCALDSDCSQLQDIMEASFDETVFFKNRQLEILNDLKAERAKRRSQKSHVNLLAEWDKRGKLGAISQDAFSSFFTGLFEQIKEIDAKSIKNFSTQAKNIFEKKRSQLLSQHQDKNTQKAINYFINDTSSFVEQIHDRDKLQILAAKYCVNKKFCDNYSEWNKQASLFDEVTPIQNLVESECPRLVLRLDRDRKILETHSCQLNDNLIPTTAIEEINSDVMQSLQKFNKE